MKYWLVKSEPFKYSWDQFCADKLTFWDGVRNYAARNNLRDMAKGDKVLFYHSNEDLAVVGVAVVAKTAYQDPTTDDANWVAVDLKPWKSLKRKVTLAELKAIPEFATLELIRLGRLSVSKVTEAEYKTITTLGGL
jgi:predicted RNA-binding protein with PUA-like domain